MHYTAALHLLGSDLMCKGGAEGAAGMAFAVPLSKVVQLHRSTALKVNLGLGIYIQMQYIYAWCQREPENLTRAQFMRTLR